MAWKQRKGVITRTPTGPNPCSSKIKKATSCFTRLTLKKTVHIKLRKRISSYNFPLGSKHASDLTLYTLSILEMLALHLYLHHLWDDTSMDKCKRSDSEAAGGYREGDILKKQRGFQCGHRVEKEGRRVENLSEK